MRITSVKAYSVREQRVRQEHRREPGHGGDLRISANYVDRKPLGLRLVCDTDDMREVTVELDAADTQRLVKHLLSAYLPHVVNIAGAPPVTPNPEDKQA